MEQKVFVNRILNMKKIKYIGLDMDHTLVRYNSRNFETLVYHLVVNKLAEEKNYPKEIKNFTFNFNNAIRGLIIDSKNGNILKLNRYGAIRQSYHGTSEIKFAKQKKFYRTIYVDLKDPNYFAVDTSFSIAFCVLYSQLIDLKDQKPQSLPDYSQIANDVLIAVDAAHADGTLKYDIAKNLEHYVLKDQRVVEGIKNYIKFGKKFFLLTNSEYYYTNIILEYAFTPFLNPGENWRDLFEFVITLANKPKFFYDSDLRFLAVNYKNGLMTNIYGNIVPGVYQGGNAKKFTSDLSLKGDEILYIGDHIYGDILRLKKDCNWRTALVVEELGVEITAQKNALHVERQIANAMAKKKELEYEYIELYTKRINEQAKKKYEPSLVALQKQIAVIDSEIKIYLQEQQTFYNPLWGRIFRAGAEESYFAYQVERFACIYMEKLADLLSNSPLTYYRAYRRSLAHDFKI